MIRHIHDYGAVLLCESRFKKKQYADGLSLWLRPHVKQFETFGQGLPALQRFFKLRAGEAAAAAAAASAAEHGDVDGGAEPMDDVVRVPSARPPPHANVPPPPPPPSLLAAINAATARSRPSAALPGGGIGGSGGDNASRVQALFAPRGGAPPHPTDAAAGAADAAVGAARAISPPPQVSMHAISLASRLLPLFLAFFHTFSHRRARAISPPPQTHWLDAPAVARPRNAWKPKE